MDAHALERDVRKALRARRLGADEACVLCGKQSPDCLLRARRSLLEEHHLAGVATDRALLVTLCRNCHAIVTEGQRDAGLDLTRDRSRTLLDSVEAILRGAALFFALLAARLEQWAEKLNGLIGALDVGYPGWRSLQEAQP